MQSEDLDRKAAIDFFQEIYPADGGPSDVNVLAGYFQQVRAASLKAGREEAAKMVQEPTGKYLANAANLLPLAIEALKELIDRIEEWEQSVASVIDRPPMSGMDLTEARAVLQMARECGAFK